jgi:hypothetical protein
MLKTRLICKRRKGASVTCYSDRPLLKVYTSALFHDSGEEDLEGFEGNLDDLDMEELDGQECASHASHFRSFTNTLF